ncbi:MAG: tRNA dihydrouridine synthase DusB [Clostridia bacterium]|nr:tRNA dihydrouridine synthase DusB [Clostridia bacterium]
MKIGNLELNGNLFLAPMAGLTDRSFRAVCKRYGVAMTYTEMISSKALHYKDKKTAQLAYIQKEDGPTAAQIFGHESEIMAEAAYLLAKGEYAYYEGCELPDVIDINMGCPVKKIVTSGDGSALMKTPELIFDITKAVRGAIDKPLTVKLRAGWDSSSKNALECALAAQEGGADAVCIHGRTREEFYTPPVDLSVIAEVKSHLKIPVIGNGGIFSADDAMKMLGETKCDGLMIARGAVGNPFIFAEISARISQKEYNSPEISEKLDVALEHARLMASDKGENISVHELKKHIAAYIHDVRGAAGFRSRVFACQDFDEMINVISEIREIYK